MRRMTPAPAAELLELQTLGRLLLVLGRDVIPALALGARQRDVVSHDDPLILRRSEPREFLEPKTAERRLRLPPTNAERRLRLPPTNTGADDRDRTGDLVLTKDVLCQLSYIGSRTIPILERETGIEPATNSLEGCDSTTELLPHFLTSCNEARSKLVARGGFEPPKPLGRQIYSLLHLTALQPRLRHHNQTVGGRAVRASDLGAGEGIRTPDLLITNQLLYQLSYASQTKRQS